MPSRSVKFDIIGDAADGKRAFRDTADEADRTADRLDNLGESGTRSLKGVGDEADRTGHRVGDLGHDFRGIDDEIRHLTESTTRLKRELAATGDKGVLRDLGRDESMLRRLRKVRGEFAATETTLDRISKMSMSGLSDTIGSIPSQLKGALILGVVGGLAAVSPLVISAVAGAAVTAAVAGAVGGGIALSFRDLRVQGAAADLADDVKRDMLDAGRSFVEPVQQGITLLRQAWRADVGPELTASIRSAAQYVQPLARAGAEFATPLVEGFRYMVDRAGPVIDMLESDLPGLGQDLKQLMKAFGDNADTGAAALHDVLTLTRMIVDGWTAATRAGAAVYDTWKSVGPLISGTTFGVFGLYDASNKVATQAKWVDPAVEAWNRYKLEIDANTAAMKRYNTELDETIGKTLNLDQSTIAFQQGMRQLREELAGNKHTLDANTAAGLENRKAILQQIEAADRMRQAAIAAGDGTWAASQKADQAWRSQVLQIRQLMIALGYATNQVDAFLSVYLAAVHAPNIYKTITIREVRQGTTYVPAGTHGFFSSGGPVRGGVPGVDSVPIVAMPGEYVLRKDMVDRLGGPDALESLRLGRARPATPGPAMPTAPMGGGMDPGSLARLLATELRRALAGATLVIDDRSGTRAQLMVRAG